MSGSDLSYGFCRQMVKLSQPPGLNDTLCRCACLLILLCTDLTASAQYRYDVWTADSGLPQNVVRGVYQAPDGFLWVATFDGLVHFDGVHFTVFNKSNTPGIESNRFGTMYGDRSGDLWLNTEGGGLTRYHNGVFQTLGSEQGITNKTVRAITGDDAGHVWILNADTIEEWNENQGRFVDVTPTDLKIPFEPLRWENSGFWGWDQRGLHCFIRGRYIDYPLPQRISGGSIFVAAYAGDGTLWIETFDGKYIKIGSDKIAVSVSTPATRTYIDGDGHSWTLQLGHELYRSVDYLNSGQKTTIQFTFLYEDRERNLWLGTEGQGLYRLQKQSIGVYSKQQGLIADNIYPIFQDHLGAMWIGAWNMGLSRFYDGKFTNFTVADGLPARLVTSIYEDRANRIWVAAHGGVAVFQNGHFSKPAEPSLPDRSVVQAIFQDRTGTLWFGTSRGLVSLRNEESRLFTVRDGLAADDVRVIIESREGDLWIGGYGGLTRLRNGRFTQWTEHEGLPSNNVRALYEDSDDVLWIGTYDGGLGRYKDGTFRRITTRDGLFNNGVFQILEDGRGNLWMSCNRGIYRVSKQELNDFAEGKRSTIASVAYGKVDGMTNVECNGGLWPAGAKTRDGKLWFPTQQGIAVIDPAAVSYNPKPPPVVIESFRVDRMAFPLTGSPRIPPRAENLEIEYTAPSFIKPEQTHFKYRLEGLDSSWIDAGARRVAYYSHLPPGRYTFHVIAGNSDGVWNNQGKTFTITILAPFYETWWFEMLTLLAIGALVAIAWRYRVSQLEQAQAVQQAFSRQLIASQEAERKRIAAEMHDSLGQRLVVIKNLALFLLRSRKEGGTKNGAGDDADAQTITEISDEASSAIEETREISYNLRPFQLDRLGLTKAIEAMIRTTASASGLKFSSELDNVDNLFPEELRINFYRIVQESLGNVMKHAEASAVKVEVKRSIENVTLTIEDNGRGFTPETRNHQAARSGFGLTGMAERAHLLGGDFKVRSAHGHGTMVTVEIPLTGGADG
jgi:signal transduction histidine kinase/ligand-binding sensor domain-containing protein